MTVECMHKSENLSEPDWSGALEAIAGLNVVEGRASSKISDAEIGRFRQSLRDGTNFPASSVVFA